MPVTFDEHLQGFLTWLRGLADAPTWGRVVFVNTRAVFRPPAPAAIPRALLLTPHEFAPVFDQYMDGRYAWLNFQCLGVMDDTLYLTFFVSSRGPTDKPTVPREHIAVNFSGPNLRTGWDASAAITIV